MDYVARYFGVRRFIVTSFFVLLLFSTALAHADVDLVINLNDTPDPVAAGGKVTYTIILANDGDEASLDTSLVVTLPATDDASFLSYNSPDGVSCGAPSGGSMTCDFGVLNNFISGESKRLEVVVETLKQSSLTLTAVASTTGTDLDPSNGEDTEGTTVESGADVSLTKSASLGSVSSGSQLSYNLSLTNHGPDAAIWLQVEDPIPAGFQLSSLPAGCTNNAGTIHCDVDGPIAMGDHIDIGPITGLVTVAGGSTITNIATVSLQPTAPNGTPTDPNTDNNSDTEHTTVTAGSDVSITKSRSVAGSLIVGTSLNFILTPRYSGDNPVDLIVTDTIPTNYSIDSNSFVVNGWNCSAVGQDVTCTRADGGGGNGEYQYGIGAISIPVTVVTSGVGIINNTAIVTSTIDNNLTNNSANDGGVTLLDPTVNLGINKSGPNPALVVKDVEFDYFAHVNNTGNTGYYGTATMTDSLPVGLTVTDYTPNGWSCDVGGSELTPANPAIGPVNIICSRDYAIDSRLASGANSSSVVFKTVADSGGVFVNSATVTTATCNGGTIADCNDGDQDTYSITSSVDTASADIRLLKTVDAATVEAGAILTYTLEVVNDDPDSSSDSTTVKLTDTFSTLINNSVGATDAGYIDHVINNGVGSCATVTSGSYGRRLTCDFPTIPECVQGVDCPTVTVRVRPGLEDLTRNNTASVISLGTADPDHDNETASVNVEVTPRTDVAVSLTATPGSVPSGQNLEYVVAVRNNGPSRAQDVSIVDILPVGVTFISASPSSGSCGVKPSAGATTTAGDKTVSCDLGDIELNGQQTVTIVVKPNSSLVGTNPNNTVTVTTTTDQIDIPALANNSDSITNLILAPSFDLVLNKVDTVDPNAVGDNTQYTVTVSNSGPSAVENVVLTDTLPVAGLSFVSASSATGVFDSLPSVDDVGGTVTWNVGYMGSGSVATLTVTMKGVAKGVYTNSAEVTSDATTSGYETNEGNNSADESTTVRTKADMEVVSKIASADPVLLRQDFHFDILVRNNSTFGPITLAEADDVEVSDSLPTGMVLTAAPTVAGGSCTGVSGETSFSCDLGTVASGATRTITVPVQLVSVSTMPETFTNEATVTTSSYDVNPANDSNNGTVSVNSSSLSGKVYRDFNNDGVIGGNDSGIQGVEMTLSGTSFDSATINRTVTTDALGNYIFSGVPEGAYTITQGAVTEGYLVDGDEGAGSHAGDISVNDVISAINLPASTDATDYIFAEVPQARIGIAKRVSSGPTVNADGTYNTAFLLTVENFSLEPLDSIIIQDLLSGVAPSFGNYVAGGAGATLANGEYTIQTALSGSCGGLNASFDGNAGGGDTRVATIPSLNATTTCTIAFTLRARSTAPLPAPQPSGGRYENQAEIISANGTWSGQTEATNLLSDLSDNGSNPDPSGDHRADGANEDDPTPVAPSYSPTIEIVKSTNGAISTNGDGSVVVPVRLVVTNTGNEPEHSVSITDILEGAAPLFGSYVNDSGATLTGGEYVIDTVPSFNGVCTNGLISAGFDGTGAAEVATISSFAIGATCTIDFAYRFMPEASESYSNVAATAAVSDYTETDINDNDSINVPYPRVGLAKWIAGGSTTNADGTVTVPFSVLVENLGGEALKNVSVTDDASGGVPSFGAFKLGGNSVTLLANEYTIETAPTFAAACANGAVNNLYNGHDNIELFSVSNLAVSSSCTANFELRFRPGLPFPVDGVYENQAHVDATGNESDIDVADDSDNGSDPDTNDDGLSNGVDEDDPTPVTALFTPRIGVAKTVNVDETINADGTVSVPFRVWTENNGTEPLVDVVISDQLTGVAPLFGAYVAGGASATLDKGEYTIDVVPAFNGACSTGSLTALYDGNVQNELATLTRLEVGNGCSIDFTLRFNPSSPLPVGGYSNQAQASGDGELTGDSVSDLSQDGVNPDPNNDDDATDNDVPTPVNPNYTARIGISKALHSGLAVNGDGSFSGVFQLKVENLGNEDLLNVEINDGMNSAPSNFGTFVAGGAGATLAAGQYSIESVTVPLGVTENAMFDGESDPLIATVDELVIGATQTIEFGFRFVPITGQAYLNQATTEGTGAFSGDVETDLSDDGTTPDTNGNHVANEVDENDPTPVPVPSIGVAKAAGETTNNGDGTHDVTFTVVVQNAGQTSLTNVQLIDDLSEFGSYENVATPSAGNYTIIAGPTVAGQVNGSAVTAVDFGDFTGEVGNNQLLAAGGDLPNFAAGVESAATIQFTLRFSPTTEGPYNNTVQARGESPTAGVVLDDSVDGGVPDLNGNGTPNDDDSPTPVTPTFTPAVEIEKTLNGTVSINGDGSVVVPVRLVVSNTGNEPLESVSITDLLSGVAPHYGSYVSASGSTLTGGQYVIATTPIFSGVCANGVINAGFDGDATDELATISTFGIGSACTVDFSYRFMPVVSTSYANTAAIAATSEYSDTSVNDDDTITVSYPRVGLAKQVNGVTTTNDDGTVTVPFSVLVRNLGGEALSNVIVADTVFGAAPRFGAFKAGGNTATLLPNEYTVESAPTFSGACTNGTENVLYNGHDNLELYSISSLAVAGSCTATFELRFRPGLPVPVDGVYENQAVVLATGADSTIVTTDLSDDGDNPDTNGDGVANGIDEDDPTLVTVTYTPRIAVAKEIDGAEVINEDGTVIVAFSVLVENNGNEPLVDIAISDQLAGVAPLFGTYVAGGVTASLAKGEYTIESTPTFDGLFPTATLTALYDGSGQNELAQLTRLDLGENCLIDFSLRFNPLSPLPVGGYSNQARAAGDGELSGDSVTDLSQNGINPDPNDDGDATDNDVPTPVNPLHTASIGLSKTLSTTLTLNNDASYNGVFQIKVENLGNEDLIDVEIEDALNTAPSNFGTFVSGGSSAVLAAGQYSIESVTVPSPAVTENALFDGETNPVIATIASLPIGGTQTLEFGFRFVPVVGQIYFNQATTNGTGGFSGGLVTDVSDDGTTTDANGNNVANDEDEDDPTPVPIPRIGVAKAAAATINNGDGTYDVTFTLVVENGGETSLTNVQLQDNLSEFGSYASEPIPIAGNYTIVAGPTVSNQINGAALTAVAFGSYTGEGSSQQLVTAGGDLPNFGAGVESRATIQFTIRFFPTEEGPFNNTAQADGESPGAGFVRDDSVDGADPDLDGNGSPNDDESPTVVDLSGQAIGVAKAVGSVVQTDLRRFRIPYTLIISNPATAVTATHVQMTDNLANTFPTAESIVIVEAATISDCSGTVLDPAATIYDGIDHLEFFAGDQPLQPGEHCTVTFATEVDFGANPLPTTVQNNSALATTSELASGIEISSDLSDNGSVVDANGNGVAGDSGENDPTPVKFSADVMSSVSGKAWQDNDHDREDNDGPDSVLAGLLVEVVNSAGQIIGTATTDSTGRYQVNNLYPAVADDPNTFVSVRFREPITGILYGDPISQDPDNPNGSIEGGTINALPLQPGTNTVNQSLPLDPSGIVYDAITRTPVEGATVTFVGPAGFDPATHLVGGVTNVSQITGDTGFYQFLLLPGAPAGVYQLDVTPPNTYSPVVPSTILPPQAGTLDPTGLGDPYLVSPVSEAPAQGEDTTYYLSFDLAVGDPDVVNNHIPLDPILEDAIVLTKTTSKKTVAIGDLVPYTLILENTTPALIMPFTMSDRIPVGFKYVKGSALVDGVALDPDGTRLLRWQGLVLQPHATMTIKYLLTVGTGVVENKIYKNTAQASHDLAMTAISNQAVASVQVVGEPIFSRSLVIGKVFNDINEDGIQQEGEAGIPGVRIASVSGVLVTTDRFGRYHMDDLQIERFTRGRNFILKVDPSTLPKGSRFTTENPRVIRLTQGLLQKINFGVRIPQSGLTTQQPQAIVTPNNLFDKVCMVVSKWLVGTAYGADNNGGSQTLQLDRQLFLYQQSVINPLQQGSINELMQSVRQNEKICIVLPPCEMQGEEGDELDQQRIEKIQKLLTKRLGGDDALQHVVVVRQQQWLADKSLVSEQSRLHEEFDVDDESYDDGQAVPRVKQPSEPVLSQHPEPALWLTTDLLGARRVLNGYLQDEPLALDAAGLQRGAKFMIYNNYSCFIQRWQIEIFAGDTIQPLRVLSGDKSTLASPIEWDLRDGQGDSVAPGRDYWYVITVYGENDLFDSTQPRHVIIGSSSYWNDDNSDDAYVGETGRRGTATEQQLPFDRDNRALTNIPLSGGKVTLYGEGVAEGGSATINGRAVAIDRNGKFLREFLLPVGTHSFNVEVDDPRFGLRSYDETAVIGERDFFMVGMIDVTAGKTNVRGNVETLADGDEFEEDVYVDGRIAFYLKGKIKGKYLITAQMDTGDEPVKDLFDSLGDRDSSSIFRRLDPDRYYPVYGDSSLTEVDVDTQGKFFIKLEWDKSQILWGNYRTEMNDTDLTSYTRSLYGAKVKLESNVTTRFNDTRTKASAFWAEAQSVASRDELRATGGSLYYLKHADILIGSEQLYVEVRDNASGKVNASYPLEIGRDYQMDWLQGRIILTRPLSAVVSSQQVITNTPQSGNATYLVADYEYDGKLTELDQSSYGVRGSHWLVDWWRLGGTFVNESRDSGKDYQTVGVDTTFKLAEGTELTAEWGESQRTHSGAFISNDGGLNYSELAQPDEDKSHQAWKVGLDVDFSRWAPMQLSTFYSHRERGYSASGQETVNDTQQFDVTLSGEIVDGLTLMTTASIEDEQDASRFTTASLQLGKTITERLHLIAEARYQEINDPNEETLEDTLAAIRCDYNLSHRVRTHVSQQATISRNSHTPVNNRTTVGVGFDWTPRLHIDVEGSTGNLGESALIGGQYQLYDSMVAYSTLEHQNSRYLGRSTTTTVGNKGRVSDSVNIYTEHQVSYGNYENGESDLFGFDFSPRDMWTISVDYTKSHVDKLGEPETNRYLSTGNSGSLIPNSTLYLNGDTALGLVDRDVVTVMTAYDSATIDYRTKFQIRVDDGAEDLKQYVLTNYFDWDIRHNFAMLLSVDYSRTRHDDRSIDDARFIEANIGFAYRPMAVDWLNFIGKYTYLEDLSPVDQVDGTSPDERSQIFSIEGILDLGKRWQLGEKFAYKRAEIRLERDSGDWFDSSTYLWVNRLNYHLIYQWDAHAEYRMLWNTRAKDCKQGALLALYRHIGEHAKLGVGYNFTDFDDDLTQLDYNAGGWFVNAILKW